ncbi:hypothetical protein [Enterovibrio coralii]|uniref:Uncharacterized protein n=1 Tax=Enterovibrio coralii TaxID=294935 RepID=A0A135I3B3_9GAMM|nr:hypothetical protein [Enterovibrio coralii]KXF79936.1 hypothetical protein ATN88_11830 [Enterovibrio coralii]
MVGEVKIAFAKKILTNEIVCIDDVEQGLKCDCICLSCGTQVVARHGQVNAHCFAHVTDNDIKTDELCSYSPETSLALLVRQELVKLSSICIFDFEGGFEYTLNINKWELDAQSEYGTVDVVGTTDIGHLIGVHVPFPGSQRTIQLDRDFHIHRCIQVKNSPLLNCSTIEGIASLLRQDATLYRELPHPQTEDQANTDSKFVSEKDTGLAPSPPKKIPEKEDSKSEEKINFGQAHECQVCFQYYVPSSKKICSRCVNRHVGREFKNLRELYKAFEAGWRPSE